MTFRIHIFGEKEQCLFQIISFDPWENVFQYCHLLSYSYLNYKSLEDLVVPRTNIVGKVPKPRIWASFCTSGIVTIAGFHMMSLKFKLQNYRRYQDFNFMTYWSSWKLIFIPIFASKGFLVCDRVRLNF